jgi:hypothetical protein
MEGLLLVTLLVIAIVAFAAGAVILVRALFWTEQDWATIMQKSLRWRPPFLKSRAARDWAAAATEASVRDELAGQATGKSIVNLAREVEEGALHAMLPRASEADLERTVACPEEGQGIFGITIPEALALADHLRETHSVAEQREIEALARANSRQLGVALHHRAALPVLQCPLQGAHHICCAYPVRPLHCRPLLAVPVAQAISTREAAEAVPANYEAEVARGVELGLRRGLQAAGLDARVYEFNGALARALEVPDAAERWAKGEDVFKDCRRASGKPALPKPASLPDPEHVVKACPA